MKHLDLFSGIGGFALAAQSVWPDIEHTFVEVDPFCQAILKKHWPNAPIYGDIKNYHPTEPADLITGGFPCQPFSAAGKRRGTGDDRHLWPEMLRVIREATPEWVIGENVGGLLTWDGGMVLDSVFADLEAEGYEAWAFVIPACAVNAPHRRDRVWITAHRTSARQQGLNLSVRQGQPQQTSTHLNRKSGNDVADTSRQRREQGAKSRQHSSRGRAICKDVKQGHKVWGESTERSKDTADANSERRSRHRKSRAQIAGLGGLLHREGYSQGTDSWQRDWPKVATRLCIVDDGLPRGLVRPKGWRNAGLKAAGNAIVPQVAEKIMSVIKEIDY